MSTRPTVSAWPSTTSAATVRRCCCPTRPASTDYVWAPLAGDLAPRYHSWSLDYRGHGDSTDAGRRVLPLGGLRERRLGRRPSRARHRGQRPPVRHGALDGRRGAADGRARPPGHVRRARPLRADRASRPTVPGPRADRRSSTAPGGGVTCSPPGRRPTRTSPAKPPLNVLAPDALRAYVDHGFADQPDGTVRLKCRGESEARTYEGSQTHDTFARLGEIRCPVLVLSGSFQPFQPASWARQVADNLPRGTLRPARRHRPLRPDGGPRRGRGRRRRLLRRRRLTGLGPQVPRGSPTLAHPSRSIGSMAYPVPTSLSPSRVEAFTSCPLAFRFASIDRLPEPPHPATAKGSLVHRALELLFCREPARAHAGGRGRRPGRAPSPSCVTIPSSSCSASTSRREEAFFADAVAPGRALLHDGRPAPRCGPSGWSCGSRRTVGELHAAGHHRPARARRRRRARRHRLQDRPRRRRSTASSSASAASTSTPSSASRPWAGARPASSCCT